MTYHLHIKGRVQGVGFRPLVYKLAKQHHLLGEVANTVNGLHVHFNLTNGTTAHDFLQSLLTEVPSKAKVQSWILEEVPEQNFHDFTIGIQENGAVPELLVSPDFALCDDCLREFNDPHNRRYQYPFITCTNCGPRFSIINTIPFERHLTTMQTFEQCPACKAEYLDAEDRRFFSQTNSCPECGIQLSWHDALSHEAECNPNDILKNLLHALGEGSIIAVKGVGGFLLMCDAANRAAIQKLRERKHRPDKPLAVLFPDQESVMHMAEVSSEEMQWLTNEVSSIVVLQTKEACHQALDMESIAPGLSTIGVMLPHAPILQWIMQAYKKPMIATSGNKSGAAIIFESEQRQELFQFADFILDHNRDIVLPQDDSVMKLARESKQSIILRRSRGLAPAIILPALKAADKVLFASGAMLKSAFAFALNRQVYLSPFQGNLSSFDAYENYLHSYQHFNEMLHASPEVVITDLHPDYPSTTFGKDLSRLLNTPHHEVQHHEAHFAAILGEHGLFHTNEKVLGVIWDGTGLGSDGQIWGGEFFIYENNHIERTYHLEPFTNVAGDKMAKEPRLSALSIIGQFGLEESVREKFDPSEFAFYQKLVQKQELKNTSAGRYFDAIASLLSLCDINSFEGQAAMLLEQQAVMYMKDGSNKPGHYFHQEELGKPISMKEVMRQIVTDVRNQTSAKVIAARFHYTMVEIIRRVAVDLQVKLIAFSGGVFQNAVLLDIINQQLASLYKLYVHQQLSPNDECIAFGQIMHYQHINT